MHSVKHSCNCTFNPEGGSIVQHFTPEKTTATKQSFEPNLGPSAAFLLNFNIGDGIDDNTGQ